LGIAIAFAFAFAIASFCQLLTQMAKN